jgi:formylmethanofuran dehydrogenase subunit E
LEVAVKAMPKCDYCGSEFILGDGIYDDGDFMCGHCIGHLEKLPYCKRTKAESAALP